jgi:ubiquinone/menaquinone biosynthesis C-methylase UbiE
VSSSPLLCHASLVPLKNPVHNRSLPSSAKDLLFGTFQKYVYPQITRLAADDLLILGMGYEEDPPMALPLGASDEPNRFGIQLYHRTATQADLGGKRVLEVGCGHGGGASYLTRTLGPASYTGLDLNPAGIAFCRKTHNVPGLDFVQGDAQNLPFPDQSFDAVINIESSHCYPQLSSFFAEVARVLRPGGHFLYADTQHPVGIAAWEASLANAPMRMLSQRVINGEVVRAIEKNMPRWLEVVDHRTPAFLRGLAHRIGRKHLSKIVDDLESGALSYRIYWFAKA